LKGMERTRKKVFWGAGRGRKLPEFVAISRNHLVKGGKENRKVSPLKRQHHQRKRLTARKKGGAGKNPIFKKGFENLILKSLGPAGTRSMAKNTFNSPKKKGRGKRVPAKGELPSCWGGAVLPEKKIR